MIEWLLLILPLFLGLYFGYSWYPTYIFDVRWWYPYFAILIGGIAGLLVGIVLYFLAKKIKDSKINSINFLIGLGSFITFVLMGNYLIVDFISPNFLSVSIGKSIITILSFLGAWLISQRAVLSYFKVGEISGNYGSFIFDTSVLLEDKILDLFDVGLFNGKIIVPQFVLIEMQKLADSSDDEKKEKGRKGFEIIKKIQNMEDLKITIDDTIAYRSGKVDEDLVSLARKYNGRLVTLDYNLTRVAQLQGVQVLNLNHLAEILKPTLLPGQRLKLQIIRHGKNKEQGIGFTEDGTMIVVEDGGKNVGEQQEVVITNILRTNAGKLLFARINPKS
jgi:uncharacterized protein YacL